MRYLIFLSIFFLIVVADARRRREKKKKEQLDLSAFGPMGDLFGGLATELANAKEEGGGDAAGLEDLMGVLAGARDQKDDGSCPHKCSDDSSFPVPKAKIRPYSNGCSVPEGLRKGLGDYSHFEVCCDLHDACYMSCGVHKPYCESEFQQCMKHQCKRKKLDQLEECNKMADLFVTGTTVFGCRGYKELQNEGCDCVSKLRAENRVRTYAEQFYATYNRTHPLPATFREAYFDLPLSTLDDELIKKHGEMLFRLYRKYPEAIEIIGRDGKSSRQTTTRFELP